MEFTLLSPLLIIIVFTIVQFILLAHQQLVMKQAAYAAARSALVYECPPTGLEGWWDNPLGTAGQMLFQKCTPDRTKVETAMRMALITISPSSSKSETRQGTCAYPTAIMELLLGNPVRVGLSDTLHNRACYAFEPQNTQLELEWKTQLPGNIQVTRGPPPIKVIVKFRMPLLAPTSGIFGTGQRSDKSWYRQGQVEVTLL